MAVNLPGLGPDDLVPTLNKQVDLAVAGLTTEDYFVMTRVDGRTTLRELILISGFPEPRAVSILTKLHDTQAILWPGEEVRVYTPPPPPPPPPSRADLERLTTPTMGVFQDDMVRKEDVELSDEQRRAIAEKHQAVRRSDLFDVLGVGRDATRRDLKNAYRVLSKNFHPDRYFGRRLGTYKQMLSEIFDMASTAIEILEDPERRELYINSLASQQAAAQQQQAAPQRPLNDTGPITIPQRMPFTPPSGTPVIRRRAVELFEAACADHLAGALPEALAGVAAAISIDPQIRFFRRGSEIALQAQELRLAEEYVKKAMELDPNHAAAHRIYAKVLVAGGRRGEARLALEAARKIDPENPYIAAELRDLAAAAKPSNPGNRGNKEG